MEGTATAAFFEMRRRRPYLLVKCPFGTTRQVVRTERSLETAFGAMTGPVLDVFFRQLSPLPCRLAVFIRLRAGCAHALRQRLKWAMTAMVAGRAGGRLPRWIRRARHWPDRAASK